MLAATGMCEAVKKVVLEHGRHLMELRCSGNFTPLVYAVMYGQTSVARFFLEQYRAQGQLQEALEAAIEWSDGQIYPLLFYAITGIEGYYDEKK